MYINSIKNWVNQHTQTVKIWVAIGFVLAYFGALTMQLAEALIYPGLFEKWYHLPVNVVGLAVVTTGVIILPYFYKSRILKYLFYFNRYNAIIILSVYSIFSLLEKLHYPNYVYSTYHLHVISIGSLFFLILSMVLVDVYRYIFAATSFSKSPTTNRLVIAACFLLGLAVMDGALQTYRSTLLNYSYLLQKPFATLEERKAQFLGEYYFMKFIEHSTPESAIIATPPQMSPWLMSGNAGYIKYFLYPRRLINSSFEQPLPPDAEYVLISFYDWGRPAGSEYGWPPIAIPAEKIWIFNRESHEVRTYEDVVFNPLDPQFGQQWGVMKVKKL